MAARKLALAGVALPLLVSGCVVEQRDFEALREQVRIQQKQINDLKARQEEHALRVDTLNNGFKILSDKADENSRRLDDVEERGSARAVSAGLVASAPAPPLPPVAPPAPAPPPAPVVAAPPPPVAAPAPVAAPVPEPILLTNQPKAAAVTPPAPAGELITAGPKPEKLYANALSLFSNREYLQASAKFQEFVADYPDHKLAGNAQYWIGECYYSQKRFAEAADGFAKVEQLYPTSPKVPAALLKKGLSLWELKRSSEAQATLQRLLDKYPQSEEAGKAKERLERLRHP